MDGEIDEVIECGRLRLTDGWFVCSFVCWFWCLLEFMTDGSSVVLKGVVYVAILQHLRHFSPELA